MEDSETQIVAAKSQQIHIKGMKASITSTAFLLALFFGFVFPSRAFIPSPVSLPRKQWHSNRFLTAQRRPTSITTIDDTEASSNVESHPTQDHESSLFGASPIVWLNGVAILWGSQHAVIKTILTDDGDPTALLLVRFGLAAGLALLPKVLAREEKGSEGTTIPYWFDSDVWRWGVELGIYMFLGFFFQAIGLQYTTAQKSGFLLYLNVKFVPFLALALYGRRISRMTWLSAVTAFIGTALLATDGAITTTWNVGDVWTIAAAVASALFILRLETASQNLPPSSATDLNAASLIVVTAISAAWSLTEARTEDYDWIQSISFLAHSHWWQLLYLGGVTTALSNWIQTRAQRYVPAERAALIYSLDPVYGAGFAYVLLGEALNSPAAVVGAILITLAAGTNAYLEFNKK